MNTLIITMFLFVLAVGVVLLIFITLTRKNGAKQLDSAKYRSRWLSITQSMNDSVDTWHFAVMSADKLLDLAMKERGITGEKMADRLKNASSHFRDTDSVWRAHKLRNRIAHEDAAKINARNCADALKSIKRALADLGAL